MGLWDSTTKVRMIDEKSQKIGTQEFLTRVIVREQVCMEMEMGVLGVFIASRGLPPIKIRKKNWS